MSAFIAGDCVYLKSPGASDQPLVMGIDKLWTSPRLLLLSLFLFLSMSHKTCKLCGKGCLLYSQTASPFFTLYYDSQLRRNLDCMFLRMNQLPFLDLHLFAYLTGTKEKNVLQ